VKIVTKIIKEKTQTNSHKEQLPRPDYDKQPINVSKYGLKHLIEGGGRWLQAIK